jgi:hypothetical protein
MTTMRASSLSLLFCATALGCGTKTIADLDEQELASEDGGSSSDDDGPGQTVTSAGVETGGDAESSAGDTGEAIECEPDPDATCGPEPVETQAFLPPSPPISGPIPEQTEYDCTVTELEYVPTGASVIRLDCALELPVDVSMALEEITFDKLAVDQAVHVAFSPANDGNGTTMTLSIDEHPLVIAMYGTSADPIPDTEVFTPFSVAAITDVCLAPCAVADDGCYSYARQQLGFSYDGEVVATVWSQGEDTVSLDGVDYRITVGGAQGAVKVNPDSLGCESPGYDGYNFRIADVTP